jgi:hypothetical protein
VLGLDLGEFGAGLTELVGDVAAGGVGDLAQGVIGMATAYSPRLVPSTVSGRPGGSCPRSRSRTPDQSRVGGTPLGFVTASSPPPYTPRVFDVQKKPDHGRLRCDVQ